MIEGKNILPALKPYGWAERAFALKRPFLASLANRPEEALVPWVRYGYSHSEGFEFLTRESLPGGRAEETLAMIEQAARRNLHTYPLEWDIQTVRIGPFLRLRFLLAAGSGPIAEQALNESAMRSAAELLKTRAVAVGIPRHGVLLATRARQRRAALRRFAALVERQYRDHPLTQISPAVFHFENGRVTGLLAELTAAWASPEEEPAGEGNYISAVISADKDTGSETLHLLAGAPDFDGMARTLGPAFVRGMNQMLARPDFSGLVRVVIIPELTGPVADLPGRIAGLQQEYDRYIAEERLTTVSGGDIQVRVVFGLPELDGIELNDARRSASLSRDPSELLAALRSTEPGTRELALKTLLNRVDPGALSPLVANQLTNALFDCLEDPHVRLRTLAVLGLGKLGGRLALDALVTALFDGDTEVRLTAASVIKSSGGAAIEPLQKARSHIDRSRYREPHAALTLLLRELVRREKLRGVRKFFKRKR